MEVLRNHVQLRNTFMMSLIRLRNDNVILVETGSNSTSGGRGSTRNQRSPEICPDINLER